LTPGIQIGDNCIVCAGAVVFDSFPDNCVIMGNPAKVIMTTTMYKKMKLCSKNTLFNDEYPFPEFDFLPNDTKKRLILDRVDHLPIKKARINRSHEPVNIKPN
jgi:hypothetical protein